MNLKIIREYEREGHKLEKSSLILKNHGFDFFFQFLKTNQEFKTKFMNLKKENKIKNKMKRKNKKENQKRPYKTDQKQK